MLSRIYFHIIKADKIKGLTLIELVVVMIILSVLSASALPMLMNQIGKAREVELKNAVGTFNRSQQAYYWEKNFFADGATFSDVFTKLGINDINTSYASDFDIIADANSVTVATINNNYESDGTRAYSGGVFVENGLVSDLIICQGAEIEEQIDPPTLANGCGSNSQIK